MGEPSPDAQIESARAYEALFVLALFGEWAPVVADAARIRPGQRVLDVGCGTGVLAREAFERTGATGVVAGVDPNPGMLTVAAELLPSAEWQKGKAESLPFPTHHFDAVMCQFGLMFFADRMQAVTEMLRVLMPGGRLVVAVWDSLDRHPPYAAAVDLLERVAGREAADALRAPFVLGDREELAALLEDAGVGAVDIESRQGTGRFPSVRTMVEADLRGWLPAVGVSLDEDLFSRILDEADQALGPHVTVDGGKVSFPTRAHIVTGRAP
jgi:ubiquinone/menaquinone biosynthesis C-methylase UbiE